MKNRKSNGSFYTPKVLADFMVSYVTERLKDINNVTILEPSCGDGIFVKSLISNKHISNKIKTLTAIEKNKSELNKIFLTTKDQRIKASACDFLDFQKNNNSKYSLVIGNPPYIKKNLLSESQLENCQEIHECAKLSSHKTKNIWTAFLVRCIDFLEDNGVLAFVLPSELLQVTFASELRELIIDKFERIEIYTFNELLFKDCKGQDTLILIGEKKSNNKGVYYCNVDTLTDLVKGQFTLSQNVTIKESKWTHYHLENEEINLLESLKSKIKTVNDYCNSKAGIVTGANDFFIVDEKTVNKYSLQSYVQPIIQKGTFVNGSVIFSEDEFNTLVDNLKPAFLIALNKSSVLRKNGKIWNYLEKGEERGIDSRYKTSIRNNWYEVPNIGTLPEAFFFKRCNEYPKLIKNEAKVFVTDSAYVIKMRANFDIETLIYSFYNSLTLSFAELFGRYYGGGVLELTPNEFKILPVPYQSISMEKFNEFKFFFKNKFSIKEVCVNNDISIIKSIDKGIDLECIERLSKIREKLYLRRRKII